MRQLILDLLPEIPPSLDNFVQGGNAETLAALRTWLAAPKSESSFYLWGEAGSGKSHLLKASGLPWVDARQDPSLSHPPTGEQWAVDNVEALDPSGQITLFHQFNRIKVAKGQLLTAGTHPPAHLALREDLRTRLGSGLIYRLASLSDTEKTEALALQAQERALPLPEEALSYLLRHAPRDMGTLSALIIALDRYSLEQKRPITLPLLREVLTSSPES